MKKSNLGLCIFNRRFEGEKIDIRFNKDVLDLPDSYGLGRKFVLAAPPCNQFTKANNRNWVVYPEYEVNVAKKCFNICLGADNWLLENPPGRIESFIPGLKNYRIGIFKDICSSKEWVLYSNNLIMLPQVIGRRPSVVDLNKIERLEYNDWFMNFVKLNFKL